MSRRVIAGVAAIAFLSVANLLGQVRSRTRQAPPRPDYYKHFTRYSNEGSLTQVTLRNGLSILIEERSISKVADVGVLFQSEGSGAVGSSAIWLDAFLRGSFGRQIFGLGAQAGGRLGTDDHFLFATVPASKVLNTLEAFKALFEPQPLDLNGLEQLKSLLQTELQSEAWEGESILGSPYPPVDVSEAARAILMEMLAGGGTSWPQADQLRSFRERNHRTNGAILVVSGPLLPDRILERVTTLYARYPGGEAPGPVDQSAPFEMGRSFSYRQNRAGHLLKLRLRYRVPGSQHSDAMALRLLSYVLGRHGTGVAGEILERGTGLIYSLDCVLRSSSKRGHFELLLAPDPDRLDAAEAGVLGLIAAIQQGALKQPHLDRAKTAFFRDYLMGMEAGASRVYRLARLQENAQFRSLDAPIQAAAQVELFDLQRVASSYLVYQNLVLEETLPENFEPRNFDEESLLETLQVLAEQSRVDRTGDLATVKAPEETYSLSTPSAAKQGTVFGAVKRTSVLRGPEIFLREDNDLPLLHVAFLFPGGRLSETSQNSGITEVLMEWLLASVESQNGAVGWSELEQAGSRLDIVNEADFFGLRASLLSVHGRQLIRTLVEWVREPHLAPDRFEVARQKVLLNQARSSALRPASSLFPEWDSHPYSRARFGNNSSVAALTEEAVRVWANSHLIQIHPWIFVQGDVSGTTLLQDVVSLLSDSRYQRRAPTKSPVRLPANRIVTRIQEEQDPIRLELLQVVGPAFATRDSWTWQVFESLLLNPEGWFWGASTGLERWRLNLDSRLEAGLLLIGRSAHGADSPTIWDRLQVLKNSRTTQRNFRDAQEVTLTRFHSRSQIGRQAILVMAKNIFAGEGVEVDRVYQATVKALQPADISSFFRRYLSFSENQ